MRSNNTTFVALLTASFCCLFPDNALSQVGGIEVDSRGVLRHATVSAADRRLSRPAKSLARPSTTRALSLKRLEQAISVHVKRGESLPPELRFLGGLQRIDQVLLYPELEDAVLVGPAGGWKRLPSGEFVGTDSHRPLLELDDLALALRFVHSPSTQDGFIGCSIDPTLSGLQRYAKYMKGLSGRLDASRIRTLIAGMQHSIGHQQVRVFGVPADTRFAWKLVAADYRLKRIAMGFDNVPVKGFTSYMDLLSRANRAATRTQHRFWFVATYDDLTRAPDGLAWQFTGPGLAVRTAARSGGKDKEKATPIARRMASTLTEALPELSRLTPVFFELQNLVRLSVAAEILLNAPIGDTTGRWSSRVLVDPDRYRPARRTTPRQVPSLGAVRKARGRNWIFSISGGVQIEPAPVGNPKFGTIDRRLPARRAASRSRIATTVHWWWD